MAAKHANKVGVAVGAKMGPLGLSRGTQYERNWQHAPELRGAQSRQKRLRNLSCHLNSSGHLKC